MKKNLGEISWKAWVFSKFIKPWFGIEYDLEEALSFNQKEKEKSPTTVCMEPSFLISGTKFFFQNGTLYKTLSKKQGNEEEKVFFYKSKEGEKESLFQKKKKIATGEIVSETWYAPNVLGEAPLRMQVVQESGDRQGRESYWFYRTGALEKICFWKGMDTSTRIEYGYHENGKLHYKKRYENGKLVGVIEEYYEDGSLSFRGYRNQDGVLEGVFEVYHHTGHLATELHFDQGKKHGIIREWHENGQVKQITLYCFGKLVQVLGIFEENGEEQ